MASCALIGDRRKRRGLIRRHEILLGEKFGDAADRGSDAWQPPRHCFTIAFGSPSCREGSTKRSAVSSSARTEALKGGWPANRTRGVTPSFSASCFAS
jgi:hypothetical protein